MLASVGAQLQQVLRGTDTRCRYGGDEFLLIFPDTPTHGAAQVAEHLRREIAAAPRDAHGLRVTASIGVATARPGKVSPEALIARADEALYDSKRAGRNRCTVSDPVGPVEVPAAAAG